MEVIICLSGRPINAEEFAGKIRAQPMLFIRRKKGWSWEKLI
jgi:hypothetical protein